ncbi:MAG: dTDP-4-dehydrorhamnose reductase [Gammaproteobacteria bacterium]|nr:dTDP-4-dehydrorhamnose reductase [Gammaproteobacteria bacterium]
MKILITGAQGQLAWDLINAQQATSFECIGLSRKELDITHEDNIQSVLSEVKPNTVINVAAYTQVDRAEEEKDLAFQINGLGPQLLAKQCNTRNIPLIHVSTNYVFDGKQTQPYREEDPTHPINVYGASKLEGEIHVKNECAQHIILRVSGLFGKHGNNFVKTMLRLFQEREELNVVDDQFICPTPTCDIATSIWQIIERLSTATQKPQWGTYHYNSSPPVSWYQFTETLLEIARTHRSFRIQALHAISTDQFKTAEKRPLNSVLNCEKIFKVFGIEQRSWEPGLRQLIEDLLR